MVAVIVAMAVIAVVGRAIYLAEKPVEKPAERPDPVPVEDNPYVVISDTEGSCIAWHTAHARVLAIMDETTPGPTRDSLVRAEKRLMEDYDNKMRRRDKAAAVRMRMEFFVSGTVGMVRYVRGHFLTDEGKEWWDSL